MITYKRRAELLNKCIITMNETQLDEMDLLSETVVDFLERVNEELNSNEENLVRLAVMLAYIEIVKRRKNDSVS